MGMLVLTRRANEKIVIGGGRANGGIDVMVLEVRGEQVRIGISAPEDVRVDREEVDAVRDPEG